jgi:acetylglutamate kinase
MESVLIKLSGTVLDNPERLTGLTETIKKFAEAGKNIVITHGGGVQITRLSGQLGIPVTQIQGRRVTDEATLDVLLYSVAGALNTRLVHMLVSGGVQAVGLTGIDASLTTAVKRPPQLIDGQTVDFGRVGDVTGVDVSVIKTLFSGGLIPVVACVTHDAAGPLNVNGDTIANALAVALGVTEMIVLMDVPAVLDAQKLPIAAMTAADYAVGKAEGWIKDGMIPKLDTCFASVKAGIPQVRLASPESFSMGGGTRLVS